MSFIKKFIAKFDKKSQVNYVSPTDQFIAQFNKLHPNLSNSQRYEIDQQKRINYLRDNPVK